MGREAGRPRTPGHLKVLAGTARPDRPDPPAAGDLEPLEKAPKPPAWMKNAEALAQWNRLAPILLANKLLTEGNVGLLEQLCAVSGQLAKAWGEEETPAASLMTAYRSLMTELGLGAMKLPAPKPEGASKENRFARNGLIGKGAA